MSYSILPQFQGHTAKWNEELSILSEETRAHGLNDGIITKCSQILQDIQSHLQPKDLSSRQVTTGSLDLDSLQKKVEAIFLSSLSCQNSLDAAMKDMKAHLFEHIEEPEDRNIIVNEIIQNGHSKTLKDKGIVDDEEHKRLEKTLSSLYLGRSTASLSTQETFWHQLIRFLDIDNFTIDPKVQKLILQEIGSLGASKLLDHLIERDFAIDHEKIAALCLTAAERGSFSLFHLCLKKGKINSEELLAKVMVYASRFEQTELVKLCFTIPKTIHGSYICQARSYANSTFNRELYYFLHEKVQEFIKTYRYADDVEKRISEAAAIGDIRQIIKDMGWYDQWKGVSVWQDFQKHCYELYDEQYRLSRYMEDARCEYDQPEHFEVQHLLSCADDFRRHQGLPEINFNDYEEICKESIHVIKEFFHKFQGSTFLKSFVTLPFTYRPWGEAFANRIREHLSYNEQCLSPVKFRHALKNAAQNGNIDIFSFTLMFCSVTPSIDFCYTREYDLAIRSAIKAGFYDVIDAGFKFTKRFSDVAGLPFLIQAFHTKNIEAIEALKPHLQDILIDDARLLTMPIYSYDINLAKEAIAIALSQKDCSLAFLGNMLIHAAACNNFDAVAYIFSLKLCLVAIKVKYAFMSAKSRNHTDMIAFICYQLAQSKEILKKHWRNSLKSNWDESLIFVCQTLQEDLFKKKLSEKSIEHVLYVLRSYNFFIKKNQRLMSDQSKIERSVIQAGLLSKNEEIVLCLLEQYKEHFPITISQEENTVIGFNDVIISAAKNGLLPVVHHLIQHSLVTDIKTLQKALEESASEGHLGIYLQLASCMDFVDPEVEAKFFVSAASKGDLQVVDLLLSQSAIQEDIIYEAFTKAAEHGHLPVVQSLYFDFFLSDENRLKKTLANPSINQHFDVCFFLLHQMMDISPRFHETRQCQELIENLFISAAASKENTSQIVEGFPSLSSKAFSLALEKAMQIKNTDSFTYLLKKNPHLTFSDGIDLLIQALEKDYDALMPLIITALKEKKPIAVMKDSCLVKLNDLAKKRPAFVLQAITAAINAEATDCSLMLLEACKELLNKDNVTHFLVSAIHQGSASTLDLLLQHSALLDETSIFQALKAATIQGEPSFVRKLLGTHLRLTDHRKHMLILLASRHGHTGIIRILLELGPIARAIIGSATTLAASQARRQIQQLLQAANTHDEREENADGIEVSMAQLKTDPDMLLEILSGMQALPESFNLADATMVIDAGGVSKDVITTLFSAIDERYKNLWTEKRCVLVDMQEQRSAATLFKNMAKVISLIYKANADKDDPLLIGPLFHEGFFSLIKTMLTISDEKALHKAVANILKEAIEDYDPLWQVITAPSESTKQAFNEFATMILCLDEEQSQEEHIRSLMANFLAPIDVFIEGLSPALQERIITCSETLLLKSIQGDAITPEAVLKALEIAEGQSAHFYISCQWIKEKISTSDIEWLKRFVYTITGRALLTPSTKINIRCFGRGDFEIHTCFNSLDIPPQPLLKQDFLSAIDNIINDSKYNVA